MLPRYRYRRVAALHGVNFLSPVARGQGYFQPLARENHIGVRYAVLLCNSLDRRAVFARYFPKRVARSDIQYNSPGLFAFGTFLFAVCAARRRKEYPLCEDISVNVSRYAVDSAFVRILKADPLAPFAV